MKHKIKTDPQKPTKETKGDDSSLPWLSSVQIPELRQIQHKLIAPDPNQPRKNFNAEKLDELAANIRQVGILSPLLVRPQPVWKLRPPDLVQNVWVLACDGTDQFFGDEADGVATTLLKKKFAEIQKEQNGAEYSLVTGERRWRAAAMAGLEVVPCLVRNLTDAQVLEIQGIENLQREGITVWEEAQWMRQLVDKGLHTVKSLAVKLGRSTSHVFGRLALSRISDPVRVELENGQIDATVAQLAGTIPNEKEQAKFIGECVKYGYSYDSAALLAQNSYRKDLKGAPFDKADAELVKGATACAECPKRSGNIEGYAGNNQHICTDTQCYKHKVSATVSRKLNVLAEEGVQVLTGKDAKNIFSRYSEDGLEHGCAYARVNDVVPGDKKERTFKQLLKDTEAKPVAAVNWRGEPELLYKLETVQPLLKEAGVQVKVPKPTFEYDSAEARAQRAAEEEKRKANLKRGELLAEKAVKLFLEKVEAAKVDKNFWLFLIGAHPPDDLEEPIDWRGDGLEVVEATEAQLRGLHALSLFGRRILRYDGHLDEDFGRACEHLKIDLKKLEKEIEQEPDAARGGYAKGQSHAKAKK
jgi:ParB/RepB/Spo0J family partition protein